MVGKLIPAGTGLLEQEEEDDEFDYGDEPEVEEAPVSKEEDTDNNLNVFDFTSGL